MKTVRIVVCVVVCCAIAVVGICGWGCKKKEAVYEGKLESFWMNMTKDSDPVIRRDAIVALGKMPIDPDRVVPTLVQSLKDADNIVRLEAVRALGKMGAEAQAALPSLETMAEADPASYVRRAAAKAIHRIGRKHEPR